MSNRVIDPRAAERRRTILITIAAVAVLAVIAALVVIFTVGSGENSKASDDDLSKSGDAVPTVTTDGAIRITSAPEGTVPPVVVTVTEDFQCPACATFESALGPVLTGFESNPDVAVDYVSINMLDRASSTVYSTRAANASMCVAEETGSADHFAKWREFHNLLFANQPAEGGAGLTNAQLINLAKDAGVEGIDSCVSEIEYRKWIDETSTRAMEDPGFSGTPNLRINGEVVEVSDGTDLQNKVNAAVEAAK